MPAARRWRLALHPPQRSQGRTGKGNPRPRLACPLITQLRAHRVQQTAERLAAGSVWQDWDLVFCTPVGSPVNSHDDWEDWHVTAELSRHADRMSEALWG
ncbi:MAG TPA: hypothetical protein VMV92_13560 [Streptosporangiaceae bacterium]|nr:hypothetical protein [Streptosporangiaceae bacterium]